MQIRKFYVCNLDWSNLNILRDYTQFLFKFSLKWYIHAFGELKNKKKFLIICAESDYQELERMKLTANNQGFETEVIEPKGVKND